MPFLAYVAIVLVSLGGILFELDWLTKPKLDAKAPMQTAGTMTEPVTPRVVAKVDGPDTGPSPLVTKKAEPVSEPVEAAAESTGATPADAAPIPQAPIPQAPVSPAVTIANAETLPLAVAPLPAATAQAQPAAAPAPSQLSEKPVLASAMQTPNHCDVQGCAAAYTSFRAADCSYQPMEGARKICVKPPGPRVASTQQAPKGEARRPSRDEELRDVERTVRRLTTTGDEAEVDPRMGRSEVIVVDRPDRDW